MKKGSKQKPSKQNQQTVPTTTSKKLFFKSSKQKKHNSQGDFVKQFPLEVSLKIFSKLDIHSLCNAAITCKSWNQTIEHCDDLWKHHCLNIRAVCQREVDGDRGKGYSWKVTLHRNYWKSKIKYEWLSGKYSNIQSRSNLPEKCMYPMDVDTWGEILEAELERVLYRGN